MSPDATGGRVDDPSVDLTAPSPAAVADGHPLVTVYLRELPVTVHGRAQEHSDALQREFRLVTEQVHEDPDSARSVPVRLIELTEALSGRFSAFTTEQEDTLEAAIARGAPSIDLTFAVPAEAAPAAQALGAMLDEADEYCREGRHLLTLATPEDLVFYRRWYLDEFIGQIGGAPPRPWPDVARAAGFGHLV